MEKNFEIDFSNIEFTNIQPELTTIKNILYIIDSTPIITIEESEEQNWFVVLFDNNDEISKYIRFKTEKGFGAEIEKIYNANEKTTWYDVINILNKENIQIIEKNKEDAIVKSYTTNYELIKDLIFPKENDK